MRMPMPSLKERASDAYHDAYMSIAGHLNRAERRTAKGKLIDAEARIAALEAENKILREAMED